MKNYESKIQEIFQNKRHIKIAKYFLNLWTNIPTGNLHNIGRFENKIGIKIYNLNIYRNIAFSL